VPVLDIEDQNTGTIGLTFHLGRIRRAEIQITLGL
jgi:hypothetical protein